MNNSYLKRINKYEEILEPIINKWVMALTTEVVNRELAQAIVNKYNVDWFTKLPFSVKLKRKIAGDLANIVSNYDRESASWYDKLFSGDPDIINVIQTEDAEKEDE